MDEMKLLIQKARNERETGSPKKALEMFLEIDQNMLSQTQIYDFLGELALTYFHLNDYKNAKSIFQQALSKSEQESNLSYQALFLRHLSKKEFENDKLKLIENSIKARELADKSNRKDLVWFDQAVISSLLLANSPKEELLKWFHIESNDLLEASRTNKDDLALWVWVTGMLIEKFQFDQDKSNLNLALIISEKFNLERRKTQILDLLKI